MTSKHETSRTILIDDHYRELGVMAGWDNNRVNRLCAAMKWTPHELGRLCAVYQTPEESIWKTPPFGRMAGSMERNHFDPSLSLLFSMIEGWYHERYSGLPSKLIMPVHFLS